MTGYGKRPETATVVQWMDAGTERPGFEFPFYQKDLRVATGQILSLRPESQCGLK